MGVRVNGQAGLAGFLAGDPSSIVWTENRLIIHTGVHAIGVNGSFI